MFGVVIVVPEFWVSLLRSSDFLGGILCDCHYSKMIGYRQGLPSVLGFHLAISPMKTAAECHSMQLALSDDRGLLLALRRCTLYIFAEEYEERIL